MHAWIGVDHGRGGKSGLCAFELTIDALSKVVDDTIGHMDSSTQHMKESGLDIHGSVATGRMIQVWTGALHTTFQSQVVSGVFLPNTCETTSCVNGMFPKRCRFP